MLVLLVLPIGHVPQISTTIIQAVSVYMVNL